MKKQYIGITGFMSPLEVDTVLQTVPKDSNQKVMIGVLVSGKTIKGIPNKWPNRYPKPEVIPALFTDHPCALNLVHYNTKEEDSDVILQELLHIQSLSGPYFDGFQLNLVWPNPKILQQLEVENIRKNIQRKRKTIVLQCGGKALSEIDHSPEKLEEKLKQYENMVDYVLIDPSGGLGIPFDIEFVERCLGRLYSSKLAYNMGFGIAGGLSSERLPELLQPLVLSFPYVSIDAEGKLRTPDDHLDIKKAIAYLKDARQMFDVNVSIRVDSQV